MMPFSNPPSAFTDDMGMGRDPLAESACSLSVHDILLGMPGGFLILEHGLKIHASNPHVNEILGRPCTDATTLTTCWPYLTHSSITRVLELAMESDTEVRHEAELGSSGRWIELQARMRRGLLHVHIQDITSRKRAAAELADANRQLGEAREAADRARSLSESARALAEAAAASAEAASVAKTSFLANMSHEIRTPMTAIVGYADMMLEPDQTPDQRRDCLSTIRRNARHLLELINDILDVSKIEAGKMTVERIEVDLPRLVAEVVSMMRPRCLEKGLDFQLIFDGPVRRHIQSDPLRLRQILVNLISNAVKFTRQGMVILKVRCAVGARTNLGESAIRFEVVDTGIGIPSESLSRLFEPFVQQDASTTRQFGGTGLGLTISRRLALMLGGDISVASEVDKGSTFTLEIDGGASTADLLVQSREVELPRIMTPVSVSLAGSRILLAEDGKDNQRLVKMYLERAGAEVGVADNGAIALQKFEQHLRDGKPFDLVLMDMQMPEIDGYSATSELRRRGIRTPIIALTAHAMADDRAKCMAVGCTEYIVKPIDRGLLLSTLARHLPNANAAAGSGAASSNANGPAGIEKINTTTVQSEFASDPEMCDVVESFVEELGESVGRLIVALDEGHKTEAIRMLHQMKGAGGGFGFPEISRLAAQAEIAVKDSAPGRDDKVVELIHYCRRVAGYQSQVELNVRYPQIKARKPA